MNTPHNRLVSFSLLGLFISFTAKVNIGGTGSATSDVTSNIAFDISFSFSVDFMTQEQRPSWRPLAEREPPSERETPLGERDPFERERQGERPPRKIKARRNNKWSEWVFRYLSIWYFGSNRCNLLPSCWAWTWAFVIRTELSQLSSFFPSPSPIPPADIRVSGSANTHSSINRMHK